MAVLKKSTPATKKSAPAPAPKKSVAPQKSAPAPIKRVAKPEPEPEPEVTRLEEGTVVAFDLDGTVMQGTIVTFDEGDGVYHVQVDEDVYGVDPEGVTVVDEEQEEEKPAKPAAKAKPGKPAAKGKGSSFASVFASAPVAEDAGAGGYPPGRHVVNITGYVREGDEDEKCSVYFETEGPEGSEIEGLSSRIYWNLLDDGGEASKGMEFFKRDIVKMGYSLDDIETLDHVDAAMQQVVDNGTQCEITVAPRRDDPEKMNIYFNGLVE